MRWLFIILVAACACAHAAQTKPAGARAAAAERQRLVELPASILHLQARELMAQGRWEPAQVRLEAYLAKQPADAAALFDAGWVQEQLGDPDAAAKLYANALANDGGHCGAALNLARLLQRTPAKAEEVLRSALRQRPDDARLLNALAAAQRAQNKLDEAASAVRRVLERHPKDVEAYRNLAAIEGDRGHLRLAESALNNARKLDPRDAGILSSLGLLALRRDDIVAARALFEEATRLEAAFAPAWLNLGALSLRYRDYAAAEQAYGRAIQLDGGRWESRLARGWALEGLGRPREARAEYEKVLAVDPRQDDALYGKALALKNEGDLASALAAFKQYLSLSRPAHLKEAQGHLAAIGLRLKHSPSPVAATTPKEAAAGLDLSTLPQGSKQGPAAEELPARGAPSAVR
jgi:tetratricopeptide (TPR) repeat protein